MKYGTGKEYGNTIDVRVERFTAAGGTFVATYLTGYVDETDLCFLGGFPGPVSYTHLVDTALFSIVFPLYHSFDFFSMDLKLFRLFRLCRTQFRWVDCMN